MTIKAIKEKYKNYHETTGDDKTMFSIIHALSGEKYVVIGADCKGYGKSVYQVVRVSDGQEMLSKDRCRPCDNFCEDSNDVACEMMWDAGIDY